MSRAPRGGRQAREPRPPPDAEQAFEVAGRFLGTRPRSGWEVEQRLRRAGAAESIIAATLKRLAGIGLVDDLAFARWWIDQRDRHAPRGRLALETELRAKRIPPAVLEALRSQNAGEELLTEEERAAAALERHLRGRPFPDDARAAQRLGMFLVRRGFDPATARAVLRRAAAESTGPGSTTGGDRSRGREA
ncbi:MAG: regulatory protein RecX [Candidatus Limnocylindria bacterium]